jgi:hypothetical protein
MITRRVSAPRRAGDATPIVPLPPIAELPDETLYKGHRIELGSYSVGNVAWSPRAVVSVRTADGWRKTPLYATSSARFPTRHEADRSALDVAKAWIDAGNAKQQE